LAKKLLDTALFEVDAYRSWQMLDPGHSKNIDERFAAMPALTKKDIRAHFPQGMLPAGCNLSQGIESGEISLVETSGTTNDKITNIWNQKWWDDSEAASWKLNAVTNKITSGSHHEAILVNPKNVGIPSDDIDLPMEKRLLARFLYLNEKTNPLAWTPSLLDRMIHELNIFQPVILEANPSYLARLCRYITGQDKSVFKPEAIVLTYEYTTQFQKRQIKQAFPNVPLISSYGSTETGYVFMECEHGKLHQNSDYCRVDFQPFKNEYGGPAVGRILVTPLRNPWSYIIRFDTGDIVQIDTVGACACGRNSGMILKSVKGRQANLTLAVDKRPVTLQELDDAISVLSGVEEYKLIQTNHNNFELHLVNKRKDKTRLESEAKDIFYSIYGTPNAVSVSFETAIAPENSGKYLLATTLFRVEIDEYLEKA
jgi:phenylacetate-CoA ligase